jgi:hypothetical protein
MFLFLKKQRGADSLYKIFVIYRHLRVRDIPATYIRFSILSPFDYPTSLN